MTADPSRYPPSVLRGATESTLREIVRRIVEVARPVRVILFGSAALGTAGPHSDLDLLVVVQGPADRWDLTDRIGERLGGILVPTDVVVATTEDIERYGYCPALVYYPALKEGKVLYDAAGVSTG